MNTEFTITKYTGSTINGKKITSITIANAEQVLARVKELSEELKSFEMFIDVNINTADDIVTARIIVNESLDLNIEGDDDICLGELGSSLYGDTLLCYLELPNLDVSKY